MSGGRGRAAVGPMAVSRRGELLGEQVDDLVPAEFRALHEAHRARYGAELCVRPIAAGTVLHAKRRDGGDFAVDISLSPLVEGSQRVIVAAVRPHNDAERDRLATALLDAVIHRLFGIGISLQSAAQGPDQVLRDSVAGAIDALDSTINEIREILFAR
jgi:signal transduction histidine kinase